MGGSSLTLVPDRRGVVRRQRVLGGSSAGGASDEEKCGQQHICVEQQTPYTRGRPGTVVPELTWPPHFQLTLQAHHCAPAACLAQPRCKPRNIPGVNPNPKTSKPIKPQPSAVNPLTPVDTACGAFAPPCFRSSQPCFSTATMPACGTAAWPLPTAPLCRLLSPDRPAMLLGGCAAAGVSRLVPLPASAAG